MILKCGGILEEKKFTISITHILPGVPVLLLQETTFQIVFSSKSYNHNSATTTSIEPRVLRRWGIKWLGLLSGKFCCPKL